MARAKAGPKALPVGQIQKRLPGLHGWKYTRGALRCEFKFETFQKALDFVARVGAMAEEADHHPDIDIRYSLVKLALSTHDAGGVTDKDFSLASAIDARSGAPKSV
jgi:4a-hydroxytetrahydrobiopterin dehydratase